MSDELREWQKEVEATLSHLTRLVETAPKGANWQIETEQETTVCNTGLGFARMIATGWRDVHFRYFVDPKLHAADQRALETPDP